MPCASSTSVRPGGTARLGAPIISWLYSSGHGRKAQNWNNPKPDEEKTIIPVRMPLTGPNQRTETCVIYRNISRDFDVSIAGWFYAGSALLEASYGDGVWNPLALYDKPTDDYGEFSVGRLYLRVLTSNDFNGSANVLIGQNKKLYESREE